MGGEASAPPGHNGCLVEGRLSPTPVHPAHTYMYTHTYCTNSTYVLACIHIYIRTYRIVGNFHGSKISRNAPWPNIHGSYFRDVAIKDKYCAMLN